MIAQQISNNKRLMMKKLRKVMKRENTCSNLRLSQRILYVAYANKMVYKLA